MRRTQSESQSRHICHSRRRDIPRYVDFVTGQSSGLKHPAVTQTKETGSMTKHKTGTREEWLAARLGLLKEEKALTRRSDELARQRQELPWVRIDKPIWHFETGEGSASLADLFQGRLQLLVYHYSCLVSEYTAGCPSCSSIADGFDGIAVHLANHDVMLSQAASHAPFVKLQAYQRADGLDSFHGPPFTRRRVQFRLLRFLIH